MLIESFDKNNRRIWGSVQGIQQIKVKLSGIQIITGAISGNDALLKDVEKKKSIRDDSDTIGYLRVVQAVTAIAIEVVLVRMWQPKAMTILVTPVSKVESVRRYSGLNSIHYKAGADLHGVKLLVSTFGPEVVQFRGTGIR